jgi:DNA modification methylase
MRHARGAVAVVIHQGDVRDVLPTLDAGSVQCVITSPPYWGLRDYGVKGQIGLEPTPEAYVATMVEVFREVRRVLRDDGTCWLNLGDSYAGGTSTGRNDSGRIRDGGGSGSGMTDGSDRTKIEKRHGIKPKDLVGIPWRVAFALQADGWYLRSDIIWAKGVSFCPDYSGSVMPESVTDRPTKSHEYLFLLTKSPRYYYDVEAVREPHKAASIIRMQQPLKTNRNHTPGSTPAGNFETYSDRPTGWGHPQGRNLRSVWTINPQPYREAHFATFPTTLVEPCVKAGSKKGDTVLDPFAGSGTTGLVAGKLGREFVGIELNADYIKLANDRIEGPLFV